MRFKFFGIQNFYIKKSRGIFLYNFTNRKIKFLSNLNHLFISKDKEFTYNFKKNLAFSFNLPISFVFNQKRNLFFLIFFNRFIRKYFLSKFEEEFFIKLRNIEYKKKFENNLNNLNNSELLNTKSLIFKNNYIFKDPLWNIYKNIIIDYNGYDIINRILLNYKEKNLNIFSYCSSIKRQKILIDTKIIKFDYIENLLNDSFTQFGFFSIQEDIKDSSNEDIKNNNINENKNNKIENVLFIEGFPYWELENWLKYLEKILNNINNNILVEYCFEEISNISNLCKKRYDSINDLSLKYLKENVFENKDLPQYLIKYYMVLNLYKIFIKIMKKKGYIVIIDDSWTSFRVSPILNYIDFIKIYQKFKDEIFLNSKKDDVKELNFQRIIERTNKNFFESPIFDYYIFGDNITQGLNFNILISGKDEYIKQKYFVYEKRIAYKMFKIFYLKILSKDYYNNYYFFVNKIYNKIKKISENLLIGPYINVYERYIKSDNKIENKRNFNIFENKFYFSFYKYGVIPLKIREEDFKSLINII